MDADALAALKLELGRVKTLVEGGGINTCVGSFDSFDDVKIWCKDHLPAVSVIECLWDIVIAFTESWDTQ